MTKLISALLLAGTLSACVSPDTVAWRRCQAAGIYPGDYGSMECYDRQMDRIQAGYAALAGVGLGLVNASRPVYPATIYVVH